MLSKTDVTVTETIARFIMDLRYEDLPAPVTAKLKECLLDTVGISAFAVGNAETSLPFRTAVQALGGEGQATVIGESRNYSFLQAAMLNGAYAHTLDFDDTNLIGSLHPSAPVIAAALVVGERATADGKTLMEAMAVGHEITVRIGAALGPSGYDRGFHITSVAGIFGAVAAAAKIENADFDCIVNALGLAATKAAGSIQFLENGAWNKRLHPGFAAHDALVVLEFAKAGVMGPTAPIEGRRGFLQSHSDEPNADMITNGIGQEWLLLETAFKPYPSCRFAHSAVDLALALREKVPAELRQQAKLTLKLARTAAQIVGERVDNKIRPRNIVDAQFSVYFQMAAAWLDGRYDWQSYERIGSAEVESFSASINVILAETLPYAGAELQVEVDGKVFTDRVDDPLGEPSNPMSWVQLEQKFQSMAVPVYGAEISAMLSERIQGIEKENSVRDFMLALRVKGGSDAI